LDTGTLIAKAILGMAANSHPFLWVDGWMPGTNG